MKRKIGIEMSYSGAVKLAADSNYDYNTAMYELIDNSFASKAKNVEVTIYTDISNCVRAITITDDGVGLAIGDIGSALAPGAKKGDGINEHGVGMKAAIEHFGTLDEMWSSTGSEEWYLHELDPDNNDLSVEIEEVPASDATGMVIQIHCGGEGKANYELNHAKQKPSTDAKKWGRRYADILASHKKLKMVIKDSETSKVTKKEIDVVPWYADYESEPLHEHVLVGANHDWEATLSVYRLKTDYGQYDPVKATNGSGGIDIVMHGRCVVERSRAPLAKLLNHKGEPVDFSHPSYNRMYGKLVVKHGIKTTPKKDNIQENDPSFVELTEMLAGVWEDKEISANFKSEGVIDVSEAQIESNLMAFLEEQDYEEVEHQQEIKYGFRTDVQAVKDSDREVWEVKKDKAMVSDLVQLVNYMTITGIRKGYLVADGFHGDVKLLHSTHYSQYNIDFWDLGSITYKGLKS